jgi:uncharacterized protein (TIGR02145 family)
MKKTILLFIIALLSLSCSRKSENVKPINTNQCIDNNGRIYKTIEIGKQLWMAENLAYLPIINKKYDSSNSKARYYVYNYEGINTKDAQNSPEYKTHAVLYNYEAAIASAPNGWHIPSDEEWKELELTLGMTKKQVNDIGFRGDESVSIRSRSTNLWQSNNGTNEYGLNIYPSGILNDEFFQQKGKSAFFWTSSQYDDENAWIREFSYIHPGIKRTQNTRKHALSVRCLKTKTE